VFEATGLEVTVKVAVVAFAATVTLAGTCAAAALLLERVTTTPPAGARPFRVTVPVEEVPPITTLGVRVTELNAAAKTFNVAAFVEPYVPEIANAVLAATALVITVKVVVVAPAATVTPAGTSATAVLLLDRVTTAPPAGAGLLSVTVPVEEVPPRTEVGLRITLPRTPAITVKLAFCVTP
jgi:hypothetical protein